MTPRRREKCSAASPTYFGTVSTRTLERARRTRAGVAANVMTRERRSDANESVESTRTGEVSTNYNAGERELRAERRKA